MPYSEPTNLAVVACPGGEKFADEVIQHIRHMYKHRFSLKADVLSKRYSMDKATLVHEINMHNDLNTSELAIRGAIDKYRAPLFKINTQFTWFANGEFKAELVDSVRGKDVFIFQDAENHEPIPMNGGKVNLATKLEIDKVINIVGMVGAGKTTLLKTLTYVLDKQKKSDTSARTVQFKIKN